MLMYELIRMRVKEELAYARLRVVSPTHRLEAFMVEAERRAELFRKVWIESPSTSQMTPRCAGLESVYDDVVNGRLM